MFFFSNFKLHVTFLPRCWDQSQDPTSGKCTVFHGILPWSCIIPNEILSQLIVVGSALLCRRKRRSRNSTRASSKLGPGAQLSSIPLWWSQWETVLTLPESRACYVFWLLGRQGVLQCGGKSHVIIMEMLQSLGCETQLARDFSQSPSKQIFLILAQSVVSVFFLS